MENETSDIQQPSLLDKYRTKSFTYHGMENYSLVWNHFNKCRQESSFTDVVIEVDNKVFPCHKILLDACCPYFSAYFSFTEPQNEKIHLQGVSLNGFTKLLDFMYTATLTVSDEDVIDILECADFLQLRDVVHACSGFLLQHIHADTCLKIFQIAESHSLPDLKEAAWNFIQRNFGLVCESESFFYLPKNLLNRIVASKTLAVRSETEVLRSVLKWLTHDFDVRKNDFEDLVTSVGITKSDLGSIDAVNAFGIESFEHLVNCIGEPKVQRYTEVMVVVSRDTNPKNFHADCLYFYHPDQKRWTTLTSFPFIKRHHFGIAVLHNRIYLTGGVTSDVPLYEKYKEIFSDTWEYDVLGDVWKQVKSMNGQRYNHSCTTFLDKIYVVGGRGTTRVAVRPDGEVYDQVTDQWTKLPEIKEVQGIGNASFTTLDGKLYLLGGMHSFVSAGRRDISFDTYMGAQYYDPMDNEWHDLPFLGSLIENADLRLSRTDCIAVEGFLLIINDSPGKRLKIYNPVTKTLGDFVISHGHHKFGACQIYNDELIISGGIEDKFVSHDMVHALNLRGVSSEWRMLSPLPCNMSHHKCVMIYLDLEAATARSTLISESSQ